MECVAFHFLNNHVERQDLDQKLILVEINVLMLFPLRGASSFVQEYKSQALCKVSSRTSQRFSRNFRSGLRSANSCVKMILDAPSLPLFHSLSLMNLDIVKMEYGHDVFFTWLFKK